MAGPGPSSATYAARSAISSSSKTAGFASAWAPGWAIGIRPVPTWKSTAAAPTPASGGPYWVPSLVTTPSPFWPWQNAQLTRNSSRPSAAEPASLAVLSAEAGAKAA